MTLTFGVSVPTSTDDDPVARARTAEELGFDFVSASDHPAGSSPTYETWTMLTWIAAATSRISVATRVLGVPYRPPAMVAKMAETLDRVSGGRLILGLGGGYSDDEFQAFGLPVPSARDKVDGLADAVQICRGLWTRPRFSFTGRRYAVTDADLEPKPGHRIPVWLGTFGERALRVTGAYADGWIPSLGYVPTSRLAAMRDTVLAAAVEAGRSPDDITCALNLQIRIGQSVEPDVLAGSPSRIVAGLREFVAVGFTSFNVQPVGADPADQLRRLAGEVIPELRA
jgi:alkanesulfonate monooxygenase SsuD/methylene tetrahydromethanopterin reductase-like flavin-dependent oxidoreductase (luciferase family)